jgi:hypothetical protein
MSVTQQASIPVPVILRHRRDHAGHHISSVRSFIAAVAWVLAGAGIALVVIVASALAQLRVT